jgi:fibronectin-binding autotransporter adhesin
MTTYTWTTGVSGDWATATDWTPAGGPPDTTTAVALIDAAGTFTVGIADGESFTANQVTLHAAGAALSVTGGGTLNLSGSKPELTVIAGTLDVAGGISGGGAGGALDFGSGGVLINAGTVQVGGGAYAPTYGIAGGAGGTLTFGTHGVLINLGSLDLQGGIVAYNYYGPQMYASGAGSGLTLGSGSTLSNRGVMQVGGGTSSHPNLGRIPYPGGTGATLTLGSLSTLTNFGTLALSGGDGNVFDSTPGGTGGKLSVGGGSTLANFGVLVVGGGGGGNDGGGPGTAGTLSVGAGSTFANYGSLYIAGAGGGNESGEGAVGGLLSLGMNSRLTNFGTLDVGGGGSGKLGTGGGGGTLAVGAGDTLTNYGSLDLLGGQGIGVYAEGAFGGGGAGGLLALATNSALTNFGALTLGGGGATRRPATRFPPSTGATLSVGSGVRLANYGTVTVAGGAGGEASYGAGGAGLLTLGPNSRMINYGELDLGGGEAGEFITSGFGEGGAGATLVVGSGAELTNAGSLDLAGGGAGPIPGGGAMVSIDAGGVLLDTGTLTVAEGATLLNGGMLQVTDGGTLTNLGAVVATDSLGVGVWGIAAGWVFNGDSADKVATISGGDAGIWIASGFGLVDNSGTISGSLEGVRFGAAAAGTLANAGVITSTDFAVLAGAGGVTVSNLGSIAATGSNGIGVHLTAGDTLINGAATNATATISGVLDGVFFDGAGTVENFATISCGDAGIWMASGFGAVDNSGTISGSLAGVRFGAAAAGTLANAGVITSTGTGGFGVLAGAGGVTVSNLGRIAATGSSGIGVHLTAGDTLTNGAATNATATISGVLDGVFFDGAGTVENFGTISGTTGVWFIAGATGTVIDAGSIVSSDGATGTAVFLRTAASRVVADPGATFVGKVLGGGGTLELAAGSTAGATGGIGTAFAQFSTLTVDPAANWTLQGGNVIGTVVDDGTLALAAGATLAVTAAVDPASTGIFELNAGALLSIAADPGTADRIAFLAGATLDVLHAAQFGTGVGTPGYAGPLIESFSSGDTIDLKDIIAAGATMSFTEATGLLQIASGASNASLLFDTASLGSGTFHLGDDSTGHLLVTHS